jgi:hypothetical protein
MEHVTFLKNVDSLVVPVPGCRAAVVRIVPNKGYALVRGYFYCHNSPQ